MESLLSRFGKNLRTVRKEKGYSLERLSELSGLDYSYISSVERGLKNISLKSIEKLARGMSVPVEELLSEVRSVEGAKKGRKPRLTPGQKVETDELYKFRVDVLRIIRDADKPALLLAKKILRDVTGWK